MEDLDLPQSSGYDPEQDDASFEVLFLLLLDLIVGVRWTDDFTCYFGNDWPGIRFRRSKIERPSLGRNKRHVRTSFGKAVSKMKEHFHYRLTELPRIGKHSK